MKARQGEDMKLRGTIYPDARKTVFLQSQLEKDELVFPGAANSASLMAIITLL